ncbi:MAG: right-handed parallel beta-helix repeat-containing protein [Deltaproteobacteria bacterium]|nr:right-handed parallel beta-helix repeat-containing protein [Deltaproteobacteria bacterium]
MKVSSEADTFAEGSLRTVLLKAATLRHQNAFSVIKIEFENQVKKINLQKNPLPSLDFGFVSIDCGSHVILDASLIQEKGAIFVLDSQANQIKNCELTHFPETGILILGNENNIEGNHFTQSPKSSALVLGPQASLNKIKNCQFENLDEAIHLSSNSGWGNELSQNQFKQINQREIMNRASRWDSPKINLRQISGNTSEIELLGNLNEEAMLELYYSSNEKQWLPLQQKKVQPNSGEFRISFNVSGIPLQSTFAVIATTLRKNTSEFSNALPFPTSKSESSPASAPALPAEHPATTVPESQEESPKIDPLLNSNKLPGLENLPTPSSEKKSEINIQSNKKSGPSDFFKVEILDAPSVP